MMIARIDDEIPRLQKKTKLSGTDTRIELLFGFAMQSKNDALIDIRTLNN